MKQYILAGLLGGIILFLWGALVWNVLPLHTACMKVPANEDAVIAVMKQSMGQKGVYLVPAMPEKDDRSPEEMEVAVRAAVEKVKAGPNMMIMYDPDGMQEVSILRMIVGFIDCFLASLVAAWFLARSTAYVSTYAARVAYCGMLGILISLVTHITNWNWFNYAADYTSAMIVDTVAGWLLAGLGIGAIVREKLPEPGPAVATGS